LLNFLNGMTKYGSCVCNSSDHRVSSGGNICLEFILTLSCNYPKCKAAQIQSSFTIVAAIISLCNLYVMAYYRFPT